MCGITGFLSPQRDINEQTLPTLVTRMGDSLRHRGPDDSGTWADAEAGIALGFRRLAILGLSPTGRQAMHSADDRYAMIFNGEVYNFGELRDELKRLGLIPCTAISTSADWAPYHIAGLCERREERAAGWGWKIARQSRQDFFTDLFFPMGVKRQNFTRPFQAALPPARAMAGGGP